MGWVVNDTLRSLYPRYPLYRRLGGPQGRVWTGAENLVPTGIRSPDRPARSESLYRLSYATYISYFSDWQAYKLPWKLLYVTTTHGINVVYVMSRWYMISRSMGYTSSHWKWFTNTVLRVFNSKTLVQIFCFPHALSVIFVRLIWQ